MNALINRLKEPSTYAGLGGIAILLGFSVEEFNLWVKAVGGIFLFLSIILREADRGT